MIVNAKQLREMSNVMRADALRALVSAHSGHIGIVMGGADIVTMIFAVFLNRGKNRYDRFVLSAGHGSAMLYSVLNLAGYDVGDLDSFRCVGGLPGHPEYGIAGVAATTGPLGQGVANAIGMAIAEKHKKTNGTVYCLCSDGDLMEGVAQEAIGFAGRYCLDNLVLVWDSNGLSIDGVAQGDCDIDMRMRAAGWDVRVADGNDFDSMYDAFSMPANGPVFIRCNTVLGRGTRLENKSAAHGFGLSDSEIHNLIDSLDCDAGRRLWGLLAKSGVRMDVGGEFSVVPWVFAPNVSNEMSTREMSGMFLNKVLEMMPDILVGSADLGDNTNVHVELSRDITRDDFGGNYINYGVREHAMAAIMNGLAYCGIRAVGATFLVFSDYMRGAMRIAALSGLPVVYVLTHDSIAVGQDGPTHQPVEQIAGLRLIPNMNVFRPCNMAEVAWAWRAALASVDRPSCIILSRQKIPYVGPAVFGRVNQGGYIVYAVKAKRVKLTLLATGAEVPLAIDVARRLGPSVQVASMPSVAHFRMNSPEYRRRILRGRVVAIEAGATAPWFEFADDVIGVDTFGQSGPGDVVYREMGFDVDLIVDAIRAKIKNV